MMPVKIMMSVHYLRRVKTEFLCLSVLLSGRD